MKIILLIQARSSSARLPFKILLKISNMASIVFLHKRVCSPKNYKTVVLTSDKNSDGLLCRVLKKNRINFYRGELSNVKKRFLDYLKKYKNNDIVIRLTADNIFIDKFLIKKVIKFFIDSKKKYVYLNSTHSLLPHGISVEIFRLSLLRNCKNNSTFHKEHVTSGFDKSQDSAMRFIKLSKKWKFLNCSIDYLSDYHKIKKIIESFKDPLRTRWVSLCSKLQNYKTNEIRDVEKFSTLTFKSFIKKDLNTKLIKNIFILKNQEWKFGMRSQLNFFNKNIKKNDIHNLFFLGKELIGYTVLKINPNDISFLRKKKKFILLDTLILKKKYRKLQLGNILMHYNNNKIVALKLPAFLMCNKKQTQFYKNNYWEIKNTNQVRYLNRKIKKNFLCFNL